MATSRILLIEDDPDVAQLLQAELQRVGVVVAWRATAVHGLIAAREGLPDAVILDLGLPDFAGHLVISRLRATSQVPILVLTARDTLDEKLDVLALGADDYIVKPFDPRDVVVRLQVQLRRTAPGVITAGDLTIAPTAGHATWADQALPLTRTELRLLAVLAQHPGRVYTPQELGAALWEDVPLSRTLLRVHISHLRRKVEAAGGTDVIRTVWGIGYALQPTSPA